MRQLALVTVMSQIGCFVYVLLPDMFGPVIKKTSIFSGIIQSFGTYNFPFNTFSTTG
ncbi:hypothetical protein ACT4UL_18040 [Bacillus sp. HC-TM]